MSHRIALVGTTLALVMCPATAAHDRPPPVEANSRMHTLSNGMQEGGVFSEQAPNVSDAAQQPARVRLQQRRFAEAAVLLRELHGSGDVWATQQLARLYMHGLGVVRDDREALQLLNSAAERGSDEAALALGAFGAQTAISAADREEARRRLNQALTSDKLHIRMAARSALSRLD